MNELLKRENEISKVKLKDKIALITGAASGIGKATSTLFKKEGAFVIACDINKNSDNKDMENLEFIELDISNINSIISLSNYVKDKYERIDILVNNAGIFSKVPILEMTEDEWDKVLNVNLKGTFFLSKEIIPIMINNNYGKIINISSLSAKRGGVTSGVNYGASKAGVLAVTKYLAKYCAKYNINVNAVVPGFVDTKMFRLNSKEEIENTIKSIPLGRVATPEDIAKVILFLSTDDSNYITGEIVDVNGGVWMD